MSNRVAAVVLWLMALAIAAGSPARAAAANAGVKEVAAEGAQDRLWVAEVVGGDPATPGSQPGPERTRVYSVGIMDNDGWQRPMMIGAGVKDLAYRGTQLVALLKTGEWMFIWPDGRSTGPAIPAAGRMITLGSDGSTVWAVARVNGGMQAVTTRPTTQDTTDDQAAQVQPTTTRAAVEPTVTTAPSALPAKLVLFRLALSSWVPEGELPPEIPVDSESLSITVLRGKIMVSLVAGGQVSIFERAGDGPAWTSLGVLKSESLHAVRAKILDGNDRPIVWAAGATGAGVLFVGSPPQQPTGRPQWGKPLELRVMKADLSQPLPRDAAVVAQRVKLVFARGEKLFVQSFDWRTGAPMGDAVVILPASGLGGDSRVGFWTNAAIMAVLLLVMVGAMRRRGEIEETMRRIERIPLAPLGARIGAAIIDLWPQWVAGVYLSMRENAPTDVEVAYTDPMVIRFAMAAMLTYIFHTMVLEMLTGASIGKWVFGLRVVLLNGQRPGLGSMFVRNLMRAVDFGLLVGVLMVAMSPLRQRVGDLAAGTIVVRRTATPDPAKAEEEEMAGSSREEE